MGDMLYKVIKNIYLEEEQKGLVFSFPEKPIAPRKQQNVCQSWPSSTTEAF